MKYLCFLCITVIALSTSSCSKISEEDVPSPVEIPVPSTYSFTRNGLTTVNFPGQTIRILMSTELINALVDFDQSTKAHLLELYRNKTAAGLDAHPFESAFLNQSRRSIKEAVAASFDYFSTNVPEGEAIRKLLEDWIIAQVDEVFPYVKRQAMPGLSGVLPDGLFPRYVNAIGVEYKELILHSIVGAVMVDQALNKYLSQAYLDKGTSREDNDNLVLIPGNNFTNMEREWDEAYGYVYGLSKDVVDPNRSIGMDDLFLNHYVGDVNSDIDFIGIADSIFAAFKYGRAAIVARQYDIRDQQANIVRQKISKAIAINAVYFLQQGKLDINPDNPNYGSAFHYLSKAYGAIFSLQFTRDPNTGGPYFSKPEVNSLLSDVMDDGPNGFWDVKIGTLDSLSEIIADRFLFTVEEAANR